VRHGHGRQHKVYSRQHVEQLAEHFAAHNAKRKQPALKYKSWRDALPAACASMFNLNRYAAHDSCSRDNRDDIYSLKNDFVRLLYQQGACIECVEHERELPAQYCFGCDEGITDWGDECPRCDGTGIYRQSRTVVDVLFVFVVHGERYAWHQPERFVDWEYVTTAETSTEYVGKEERPLECARSTLSRGKKIVRYVLENAPKLVEVAA